MGDISDPNKIRIEEGVVEGLAVLAAHQARPVFDSLLGAAQYIATSLVDLAPTA